MNPGIWTIVRGVAAAGLLVNAASAQCPPQWSGEFDGGSIDGTVHAAIIFDDGSGPALYVGGDFEHAGGVEAHNIARFDGARWEALHQGLRGVVRALEVFDDGSGPALYIGGQGLVVPHDHVFESASVLKWNGNNWNNPADFPDGIYGDVFALKAHDDGSGPALFVGGEFADSIMIGSQSGVLAKWDGDAFQFITGAGSTGQGPVHDLEVFDDGSGPALYAAGDMLFGPAALSYMVRWDGASLQGLSVLPPEYGASRDMAVATINGEQALYFWSAPNKLWRWDGTGAAQVFPGLSPALPKSLSAMSSGGDSLIAAGLFDFNGEVNQSAVMRWDGAEWSPVAVTFRGTVSMLERLTFEGETLTFMGGDFASIDTVTARSLASFDGAVWSRVGTPDPGNAIFGGGVSAITALDEWGVTVAGTFGGAGSDTTGPIAMWDGAAWQDIGSGQFQHLTESFTDLAWVEAGVLPTLFARGVFHQDGVDAALASWYNGAWTLHPTAQEPEAGGLFAFDDGDGATVYTSAFDRWNGAAWEAPAGSPGADLKLLGVVDLGGGPELLASATIAGEVRLVSRQNGAWSVYPGVFAGASTAPAFGTEPVLETVAAYDDGGGANLYVGGNFASAGGATVYGIARWDGSAWSDFGGGLSGASGSRVHHLVVADDGSGPALFARGMFIVAGGELADGLAKWDGDAWSQVGAGLIGEVAHLAAFTDGPRRSLFVAGRVGTEGDGDAYETFARWGAPFFPGDATGDGSVDVDDLNAVLVGWNTLVVTPGVGGDVTRNGIVDVDDLNAVLGAWQTECR